MLWKSMDRNLKKGEIIRLYLGTDNADNPPKNWDGYVYAKVVAGHGMFLFTMNGEITVTKEEWTYNECKNNTDEYDEYISWDRDTGIEIIDEA